ncbi:MAG TPA: lipopolysaccharide kinase InaA family protein [Desulfosalsimonadaceae bacterium]|nr:lipopolysaccharide kinase InaA family protein [Desulfosalsimonadaceae bacterium]
MPGANLQKTLISKKPKTVVIYPRPNDASNDTFAATAVKYLKGDLPGIETVKELRHDSGSLKKGKINGRTCFFKELKPRNRRDVAKAALGIRPLSRALRIFCGERILARHGLQAPAFCFAIEKRFAWFSLSSVHVSEAVAAISINAWCRQFSMDDPGIAPKKRRLVVQLAVEAARLHKNHIYHGEMNLNNILCRENPDGSFCLYWIDNERTRKYKFFPYGRMVKNLHQLNRNPGCFTLHDRLRFFIIYCQHMGIYGGNRRKFLHMMEKRFDKSRSTEQKGQTIR